MNQDELRRQMDLLAEDARQRSVGRRIAGITHTNTVTTVYIVRSVKVRIVTELTKAPNFAQR